MTPIVDMYHTLAHGYIILLTSLNYAYIHSTTYVTDVTDVSIYIICEPTVRVLLK